MRRLKVYGWTHWNPDPRVKPAPNGSRQTRAIMAASSMAEITRILDCKMSELWTICETGNDDEIATAMREPRVVFWLQPDARWKTDHTWQRGIE